MTDQKRMRRDKRSEAPPKMRLTQRDIEILQAVAEFRVMRQDQIQALFFKSRSTAQFRLSHLYQHKFLDRHFLPVYTGSSPTLYTLDRRGFSVLRAELGMVRMPSWDPDTGLDFFAHTMALNDFRIAVMIACRKDGFSLTQWLGESSLKSNYDRVTITDTKGKSHVVSLIPDSYFRIETPNGRGSFFLEIDMGTMTLGRFQNKIRAYVAYLRNRIYEARYQTKSLRILTVANNEARCANLKVAAEGLGAERLFWFADKSKITPETVLHSPIWHIAGLERPLSLSGA